MQRKLATILVGDIVGSTAQMERDEEAAVQRFSDCLGAVSQTVNQHAGRVFNRAGDAVLAEFQSPVNALRAAMAARGALSAVRGAQTSDMRFGLHLADVVEIDGDLRGDGVNIAARIQAAADPGAIDTSGSVFDQVHRNSPCIFDDLGEKRFNGLSEPIHVFRVRDEMGSHRLQATEPFRPGPKVRRPHSIVVAPLTVASSADEDQQALAEGLTEELILQLGRLKQLFVISPSASMALQDRHPVSVGRDLGVRYLLTGSMRSMGTRLRFNLSLSETDEGRVLWSDRMQRPFDEFVEMIDDVIERVTATVLGQVLEADIAVARSRPTESLSAYEFYLRGLDYHRRGGVTDDNIREAVKWFDKAIDADPNFARARAMWVCSASWLPDYDWDAGRERTQHALELDPTDPEANRVMGSILMKEYRFDAARPYHEKAIRLAPNDAYVIGRCAAFHTFAGEPEIALRLLDRAAQLDPFLPVWIDEERMVALYSMGRHHEALQAARDLPFQTRRTRLYRAASRIALGETEAARAIVSEARGYTPDLSLSYIRDCEFYRDADLKQELVDRLRQAGLPD